jgi:ABC-type polar amino acid transport system ATPase subunit
MNAPESSVERTPGDRAGEAAGAMLRISGLHKRFGDVEVLRGVDLELTRGEVVVIIGPSGSGKSTLLRCINRLVDPDAGDVQVGDVMVTDPGAKLPAVRRRIGFVSQHFNLYPLKTAIENVMEGPIAVLKERKSDVRPKALELLRRVGLEHKADAYPRELSGGQQQRVAIARALAMHPELILFDEPTSALDPELTGEVLEVMKRLADAGMTMVVASHEMHFARRVADRIVMLDDGVVVEDAPPQTIFDRPRHERTRRFIEQVTSWSAP